jgi:hypothetical protein
MCLPPFEPGETPPGHPGAGLWRRELSVGNSRASPGTVMRAISAGATHTLALTSTGQVLA